MAMPTGTKTPPGGKTAGATGTKLKGKTAAMGLTPKGKGSKRKPATARS